MWASDEQAGVALRALADEPAPPAVTTLDQVVRRGRRRVRGQRLGVLAVVAAVLAAGAGAALTVWSPDPPPETAATIELGTTYAWPEQLAGWSVVEPASCTKPKVQTDMLASKATILSADVVGPAFVADVSEVVGAPARLVRQDWGQEGYVEVEVPVDASWGSVQLSATVADVSAPGGAADADAGVYGFCASLLRRTLETGTVMQLYAPDARSPYAPVQHLRTYLPDGRLYVVSSAGWSQADEQDGVVRTGRGRLPLDSQELADIAVRVARLE